MISLEASSLPYRGNTNVASFLLNNEVQLRTKSIQQYVVLQFSNLEKNKEKQIDFSLFSTALRPLSLWIDVNSESQERLELRLYNKQNDNLQRIMRSFINRSEIPFIFPHAVFTPDNVFSIIPKVNVPSIILVLEPAYIIPLQPPVLIPGDPDTTGNR